MLAAVLMLVGGVVLLIGNIMFLVKAFKAGVGWGLGVLILPPVGLVFLVKSWSESKKSFLISIAGAVLFVVGMVLAQPVPTP